MNSAEKYKEAIELYSTTDMTVKEICGRCGVTVAGFTSYIARWHRDLMYKRHGKSGNVEQKLHSNKGQRAETREKYREAVEACDSEEYIEWNVSQIAREFFVTPTGLANFMRRHYPDIIPRREAERKRRGMADNQQRGAKRTSKETYAAAVELLRTTDMTYTEAAEKCDVSPSGLEAHVHFYHKDLKELREKKREYGKNNPVAGTVSGNGAIRQPLQELAEGYAEAVELYRTTTLSYSEIAERLGVGEAGLIYHLRKWHRPLVFARYIEGFSMNKGMRKNPDIKLYRAASAKKYAEAIELLKSSDIHTAEVARRFGFNPETFRMYVREHEPELAERFGMTVMPNGQMVLKRSYEKYREAVEDFIAHTHDMNAVAERHGLVYISFANFLRRNLPEEVAKWKERMNERYAQAVEILTADKEISIDEVAAKLDISANGLRNHLDFHHKLLVGEREGNRYLGRRAKKPNAKPTD